MTRLLRFCHFLASPTLMFMAMPWLMILLVLGTLAQKSMGLYAAHQYYFSGMVFWLGGVIPMPGTSLTLGVITVSLMAKLMLKSPWRMKDAGIIISHMGVLLLLLGGLLTALTAKEGFITLAEGEVSDMVSDYHARELAILRNGELVYAISDRELVEGMAISHPSMPFSIALLEYCFHCQPAMREDVPDALMLRGIAEQITLNDKPPHKENEANQSGVVLQISGAGEGIDGQYISFEPMPRHPDFEREGVRWQIVMRRVPTRLPFDVALNDVRRFDHPGTEMAREYESLVTITDGSLSWGAAIRMNEPLRHRGYTLYQSGYVEIDGKEMTTLAVVKNHGRVFPYIASAVLSVGLGWHLFARSRSRASSRQSRRKSERAGAAKGALAALLLFGMVCVAQGVKAEEKTAPPSLPMEAFAAIPVLDEGRIKPMDSFARIALHQISEGRDLDEMIPIEWLAEVIFAPERARERPLFTVKNPAIHSLLKLEARKPAYYTADELQDAFAEQSEALRQAATKEEDARSEDEQALVSLYEQLGAFWELSHSLSAMIMRHPLSHPDLRSRFGLPDGGGEVLNYLELQPIRQPLQDYLASVLDEKNDRIDQFTPEEVEATMLSYFLSQLDTVRQGNRRFRVIPPGWGGDEAWLSPWSILQEGKGSPTTVELFTAWEALGRAYHMEDRERWQQLSAELRDKAYRLGQVDVAQLEMEQRYHQLFFMPGLLAGYVLAALLIGIAGAAVTGWEKYGALAGRLLLYAVMGWHAVLIALRIMVLERPPVGNLYESILFVSLVAAFVAWLLGRKARPEVLAMGAGVAAMLLGISGTYAPNGDDLGVLVAVLNTQFWLATHVLVITAGYGFALICGGLAHLYLWQPSYGREKLLKTSLLAALLFTSVGTILGGVWADQSWGRFWGWDPKENGALLIVLWLVWVMHGRISGHLSRPLYAALLACVTIIVALAWFGVNLLSVGLHSYGFTNEAAMKLLVFTLAELALVTVLYIRSLMHKERYAY